LSFGSKWVRIDLVYFQWIEGDITPQNKGEAWETNPYRRRRYLHIMVKFEGLVGKKHSSGTQEVRAIYEDMVPIFNDFKDKIIKSFPKIKRQGFLFRPILENPF
jgi:hypothetical protein